MTDVFTIYDYYPYGSLMPGRSFNAGEYRFGYNGQEMVNEIAGVGKHYTAEFWEYSPSEILRWNIDPAFKKYPGWSPYHINFCNPIWFSDPNGDDPNGGDGDKETKTPAKVDYASKTVTEAKDNLSLNSVENTQLVKIEGRSLSEPVSKMDEVVSRLRLPGEPRQLATGALTPVYPELFFLPLPKVGFLAKSASTAAKGVTTSDGFLFGGISFKAPINIPVQRFGNMSLDRPDFWGARIGTSQFANTTFGAIKPTWNPLTQYTIGVIPKGTPIKFGLIGPQGLKYPGGSLQFVVPSSSVLNQTSKLITR